MSLIDQAVHKVRADAADDAKLDQLLAGLGTLTTSVTTLTKRLDAVETEMKKPDAAEPVVPKDESGAKLDAIMDHLTGLHAKHDGLKATCDGLSAKHDQLAAKVDAIEESGKKAAAEEVEPAPPAIDAVTPPAKKEDEPVAAVADSATEKKLDAANGRIEGMAKLIADMQKRLPAEIPDDQKARFTAAQSKWEKVAQLFADSEGAPRAMNGETLPDYNRRLMSKYKAHSKVWKDQDLDKLPDAVLGVAIDQIHADAVAAAVAPAPTTDGVLIAREFKDPMTGRLTRRFHGDIGVMLDLSRNPRQYVTGFPTIQRH